MFDDPRYATKREPRSAIYPNKTNSPCAACAVSNVTSEEHVAQFHASESTDVSGKQYVDWEIFNAIPVVTGSNAVVTVIAAKVVDSKNRAGNHIRILCIGLAKKIICILTNSKYERKRTRM